MSSKLRRENKEIFPDGHVESKADGCQILKNVPGQETEGRKGVSQRAKKEPSERGDDVLRRTHQGRAGGS